MKKIILLLFFIIMGSCKHQKKSSLSSTRKQELLKRNSCLEVKEEWDLNIVKKSYSVETEESISSTLSFFWCRGRESIDSLIFNKVGLVKGSKFFSCPELIDEGLYHAAQLEILKIDASRNFIFWRRDKRNNVIYLKGVKKDSIGITSSFDGSGADYICQGGFWWRNSFH